MLRSLLPRSISAIPWRLRDKIKHIPFVRSAQRWLLSTLLLDREFVHTLDGGPAKGLIYPIRLPDDKVIWIGNYEQKFATALKNSIRPGDVCFDVGSWHGFLSGVMAIAAARQVYAFEPMPNNCEKIRHMIAMNPKLPVRLIQAAIGDVSGTTNFDVMADSSMGKISSSSFQKTNVPVRRVSVQMHSLDDLVQAGEVEPPDVIKIDVEGAEACVLRGASYCLSKHKPKIFIEIHSHELARQCSALLSESGYGVSVLETAAGHACTRSTRSPDGKSAIDAGSTASS